MRGMTAVAQPGWYTDPWDVGVQRYFDGTQWTCCRPPLDDTIRAYRLSEAVADAVRRGWRVESQTMFQAALVSGAQSGSSDVVWFLLGLFTCGIGWIGWIIAAATSRQSRTTLRVDLYGNMIWG